jgi:chromate transport protein ChrA
MIMLELIIVILLVLWLLGYSGRARYGGNLFHALLVIVVILVVVRLLQ